MIEGIMFKYKPLTDKKTQEVLAICAKLRQAALDWINPHKENTEDTLDNALTFVHSSWVLNSKELLSIIYPAVNADDDITLSSWIVMATTPNQIRRWLAVLFYDKGSTVRSKYTVEDGCYVAFSGKILLEGNPPVITAYTFFKALGLLEILEIKQLL